jgi:phosphosulfolactate synthase (CoM biosynthesis protein A)
MELKNTSMISSDNKNDKIRSSSVTKKKSEISAATIINSLERDIAELIQEATNRTQKNKLISLNGNKCNLILNQRKMKRKKLINKSNKFNIII